MGVTRSDQLVIHKQVATILHIEQYFQLPYNDTEAFEDTLIKIFEKPEHFDVLWYFHKWMEPLLLTYIKNRGPRQAVEGTKPVQLKHLNRRLRKGIPLPTNFCIRPKHLYREEKE